MGQCHASQWNCACAVSPPWSTAPHPCQWLGHIFNPKPGLSCCHSRQNIWPTVEVMGAILMACEPMRNKKRELGGVYYSFCFSHYGKPWVLLLEAYVFWLKTKAFKWVLIKEKEWSKNFIHIEHMKICVELGGFVEHGLYSWRKTWNNVLGRSNKRYHNYGVRVNSHD